MRMPFQRMYIVNGAELIRIIQTKANLTTFVPNLLDFGLLFSGVDKESRKLISETYATQGNGFTISVHKFLVQGPTLQDACQTAVAKLAACVPSSFSASGADEISLLETIKHDLMLALTGAIYGPENPYDDPDIEASWNTFLPGINHLLYSPFASITARKAVRARSRIHSAFADYFATGGHIQAFPMVSEMFDRNRNLGLTLPEAAKMEMATSLAMLSSGAVTTFWLLFHICSNAEALQHCRAELSALAKTTTLTDNGRYVKVVDLSLIKLHCPTMLAMLQETLRYHSTLVNVKKVHHDTTLANQYLLKKDAIIMIPGTAVHHDPEIWGASATSFDHHRFATPEGQRKLGSTLAFRPFGAGATMCPGRHFTTNVILSFAAMVLLQFEVEPARDGGVWTMPTKWNTDLWNAMPKPDSDIPVRVTPRKEMEVVQWKFVWGGECGPENGVQDSV